MIQLRAWKSRSLPNVVFIICQNYFVLNSQTRLCVIQSNVEKGKNTFFAGRLSSLWKWNGECIRVMWTLSGNELCWSWNTEGKILWKCTSNNFQVIHCICVIFLLAFSCSMWRPNDLESYAEINEYQERENLLACMNLHVRIVCRKKDCTIVYAVMVDFSQFKCKLEDVTCSKLKLWVIYALQGFVRRTVSLNHCGSLHNSI